MAALMAFLHGTASPCSRWTARRMGAIRPIAASFLRHRHVELDVSMILKRQEVLLWVLQSLLQRSDAQPHRFQCRQSACEVGRLAGGRTQATRRNCWSLGLALHRAQPQHGPPGHPRPGLPLRTRRGAGTTAAPRAPKRLLIHSPVEEYLSAVQRRQLLLLQTSTVILRLLLPGPRPGTATALPATRHSAPLRQRQRLPLTLVARRERRHFLLGMRGMRR